MIEEIPELKPRNVSLVHITSRKNPVFGLSGIFFVFHIEMERVTLQFQTPQDLSNFRKAACEIKEVNIRDLTMVCECTKNEIARAMNYYGAMVIEDRGAE